MEKVCDGENDVIAGASRQSWGRLSDVSCQEVQGAVSLFGNEMRDAQPWKLGQLIKPY
jgi:hypothetical protein